MSYTNRAATTACSYVWPAEAAEGSGVWEAGKADWLAKDRARNQSITRPGYQTQGLAPAKPALISKYHIDRTRIVAQGSQAGGAMAWLTALNHRDLIRAVAPFDTAMPARAQVAANDPIERLAIYIAYPKNSKLDDRIRAEVKRLETMKYPVQVQELEDDAKQLTEDRTQQLSTVREITVQCPSPLAGEGRVRGQKMRQLFLERC